jgi:hypothetical protein
MAFVKRTKDRDQQKKYNQKTRFLTIELFLVRSMAMGWKRRIRIASPGAKASSTIPFISLIPRDGYQKRIILLPLHCKSRKAMAKGFETPTIGGNTLDIKAHAPDSFDHMD